MPQLTPRSLRTLLSTIHHLFPGSSHAAVDIHAHPTNRKLPTLPTDICPTSRKPLHIRHQMASLLTLGHVPPMPLQRYCTPIRRRLRATCKPYPHLSRIQQISTNMQTATLRYSHVCSLCASCMQRHSQLLKSTPPSTLPSAARRLSRLAFRCSSPISPLPQHVHRATANHVLAWIPGKISAAYPYLPR